MPEPKDIDKVTLMTPRRYDACAAAAVSSLSGCAALIYEVVWFQLLQLVIGSSAVSLAVLLGTFMGGMCLGSFLLPRYVSAREHPLRVYALLELGIGVLGLLILFGMPVSGQHLHGLGRARVRSACSSARSPPASACCRRRF